MSFKQIRNIGMHYSLPHKRRQDDRGKANEQEDRLQVIEDVSLSYVVFMLSLPDTDEVARGYDQYPMLSMIRPDT